MMLLVKKMVQRQLLVIVTAVMKQIHSPQQAQLKSTNGQIQKNISNQQLTAQKTKYTIKNVHFAAYQAKARQTQHGQRQTLLGTTSLTVIM